MSDGPQRCGCPGVPRRPSASVTGRMISRGTQNCRGGEADTVQGEELDRRVQPLEGKGDQERSICGYPQPLEDLLRDSRETGDASVRGRNGDCQTALNHPFDTLKYSNVFRGHTVQKIIHRFLATKGLLQKGWQEPQSLKGLKGLRPTEKEADPCFPAHLLQGHPFNQWGDG